MATSIKISIPKPCHENWSTMAPDEKGRFCGVCAKSVIDFTKMNTEETQNYLWEHRNEKICGRFNSETIEPTFVFKVQEAVLYQQRSFKKAFLLALFVVMGTSLFSCRNVNGQTMGEVAVDYDSITVVADTVKEDVLVGEFIPLDTLDKLPHPPKPKIDEVKFVKPNERTEVLGEVAPKFVTDSTRIK